MKVLFTIDSLFGGGTESSTLKMLYAFHADMDVTVCYFYGKHDLRNEFLEAPCKLVFMDLNGNYSFMQGIWQLIKLIRKEKYDAIVTSLYRASIMSRIAGFLTATPVIDTFVNESYGLTKRKEFPGMHIIKYYIVYLIDRMTSFIPAYWISNSQSIAVSMGNALRIPSRKIRVLPRGRDIDTIQQWEKPSGESAFHFVSIGRLFSQKAQSDLISAFAFFHKKYPSSRLTVFGEGPLRGQLEHLIRALDLSQTILLPGWVPEAWKELRKAHCFVLPSYYEGLSGALIEAAISGIPVIVSDIPMNKEVIRDRETGLYFKTGDIESLTDAMINVYMDFEAADLRGSKARNEASRQYNIKDIANEYHAILAEVLRVESIK